MLVFLANPGLADFRFGGGGHRTPLRFRPSPGVVAASSGGVDGGDTAQPLCRILHRAHDVLVSGAAAHVAFKAVPHRFLVRIGFFGEQVDASA